MSSLAAREREASSRRHVWERTENYVPLCEICKLIQLKVYLRNWKETARFKRVIDDVVGYSVVVLEHSLESYQVEMADTLSLSVKLVSYKSHLFVGVWKLQLTNPSEQPHTSLPALLTAAHTVRPAVWWRCFESLFFCHLSLYFVKPNKLK